MRARACRKVAGSTALRMPSKRLGSDRLTGRGSHATLLAPHPVPAARLSRAADASRVLAMKLKVRRSKTEAPQEGRLPHPQQDHGWPQGHQAQDQAARASSASADRRLESGRASLLAGRSPSSPALCSCARFPRARGLRSGRLSWPRAGRPAVVSDAVGAEAATCIVGARRNGPHRGRGGNSHGADREPERRNRCGIGITSRLPTRRYQRRSRGKGPANQRR
jgi:hypothetical protein